MIGLHQIWLKFFPKHIAVIEIMIIYCETALSRIPQVPIDEQSTVVLVVAWCCQGLVYLVFWGQADDKPISEPMMT